MLKLVNCLSFIRVTFKPCVYRTSFGLSEQTKINVRLLVLTKNENCMCHGLFQSYVLYFDAVCYRAHNLYYIAVFVSETSFKWDLEQICLPLMWYMCKYF